MIRLLMLVLGVWLRRRRLDRIGIRVRRERNHRSRLGRGICAASGRGLLLPHGLRRHRSMLPLLRMMVLLLRLRLLLRRQGQAWRRGLVRPRMQAR